MNILGLHVNGSQSSAALLQNGLITAAAAEERFTRVKQSRAFPRKAIDYCLNYAGLTDIAELDAIAVSWNPSENMRHINNSGHTDWRRYDPEWLYIVPNNLLSISPNLDPLGDMLKLEIGTTGKCPVYFVEHHLSHLAHAICQSPFEKGLSAAIDEYSEFSSVTLATFDRNELNIIRRLAYPHSLGVFYAAITEFLGFRPNSEEWKVMGAAAYGSPDDYIKPLDQIFRWDDVQKEWLIDAIYIEHSNMKRAGYCNERTERLIGFAQRDPSAPLEQRHFDLAAAAQHVFEQRIFQLLGSCADLSPAPHLAAAGGCFMNSLANGKIISNTPFKNIFIPYAAADNGGAMGAALYTWHHVLKNPRHPQILAPTPHLGPSFNSGEVEETLSKYKLKYHKYDNFIEKTVDFLLEGKLVGWFQGRMEFGERALGARSILADPRCAEMKDIINSAVKYRESFRPFAPSILIEDVQEWFDIPSDVKVPYMEQVYPIHKNKQKLIPAVVHADGTGRLQTVDKSLNQTYHQLISAFKKKTGIPILLNTSFNIQGEPIVCTPSDAIKTFFTSGLDILVLENCIITK